MKSSHVSPSDASPVPPDGDVIDAEKSETPTNFFNNALDAVRAAAPEGSTLRVVGYDRADVFLRAGYRVTEGDSDITVARGGEREFDLARRTACKNLILVPTRDRVGCTVGDYRTRDGAFTVIKRGRRPFAVVFDTEDTDDNLASLFAEIVSLDLAAFEVSFGAVMRGERADGETVSQVSALVSSLTARLKNCEKDRTTCRRVINDGAKAAARLVEKCPPLLFNSGAAQVYEAFRMLCAAEDRPLGLRGETELLLSGYVIEFYAKNLSARSAAFPPDNNKRIDSVCEYFDTDVRRATVHASPVFPPEKLKLYEYRRNEFRADRLRMLAALNNRRNAAWHVFKRLYRDDGYSLGAMIDKTDVGICLALAPDVFAADTVLSFLKQTGRLDKYIV